jgi:selenide,water dikinase
MNAPLPNAAAEPRLTSLSHGGGCGCKIAPGVLSEILKGTARLPMPPELLVGIETADDAAVYQLNDEQALIARRTSSCRSWTTPTTFGRIAATNAISDVYAMGGKPILALALVGDADQRAVHRHHRPHPRRRRVRVQGGGHPDRRRPHHRFGRADLRPGGAGPGASAARQAQCRCAAGDVLVLGKPLGVGVLSAALKKEQLDAAATTR